jgi:hypothetical protein
VTGKLNRIVSSSLGGFIPDPRLGARFGGPELERGLGRERSPPLSAVTSSEYSSTSWLPPEAEEDRAVEPEMGSCCAWAMGGSTCARHSSLPAQERAGGPPHCNHRLFGAGRGPGPVGLCGCAAALFAALCVPDGWLVQGVASS